MKTIALLLIFGLAWFTIVESKYEQEWEQYKKQYGKNYPATEEQQRKANFERNIALMNANNQDFKAGKATYELKLNEYADRAEEEYRKMRG